MIERVISHPMRASTPTIICIIARPAEESYAFLGLQQQQISTTRVIIVAIEKKTTVYQSRAAEAV
jgi:hypothetical protein